MDGILLHARPLFCRYQNFSCTWDGSWSCQFPLLRARDLPLSMFSLWLAQTWQPIGKLVGCLAALRRHTNQRRWRLAPGSFRLPSQHSVFVVSPAGTGIAFPLVLRWQFKRSSSSVSPLATGIVTFVLVFSWQSVMYSHLSLNVHGTEVILTT